MMNAVETVPAIATISPLFPALFAIHKKNEWVHISASTLPFQLTYLHVEKHCGAMIAPGLENQVQVRIEIL